MIQVLCQLEFYSGSVCDLKQNNHNVEHDISWNIVARAPSFNPTFVDHVPLAHESWIVID